MYLWWKNFLTYLTWFSSYWPVEQSAYIPLIIWMFSSHSNTFHPLHIVSIYQNLANRMLKILCPFHLLPLQAMSKGHIKTADDFGIYKILVKTTNIKLDYKIWFWYLISGKIILIYLFLSLLNYKMSMLLTYPIWFWGELIESIYLK